MRFRVLTVNRQNDVAIMQGRIEEHCYSPIVKLGLAEHFGKFFIMNCFV